MATFKFSIKMLKKEYKKSVFYCITIIFAIAMCFVFFNIINNEHLASQGVVGGGGTWNDVQVPFSTILSFMIIIFCCVMIFFANNFFLSRKTTEIAVYTISGLSIVNSTLYLIYQTVTLMCIAAPFGIGLGMLITPLTNHFMYQHLGVDSSIYYIPIAAIGQTLIMALCVITMLSVFASGYIYRNDIKDLLAQEKAMVFKNKEKRKINSMFYIYVYVFGIIMMFIGSHSATKYVVPSFVGIIGTTGMIRCLIPDLIKKWKNKKLITKRYALIYISNLNYSMYRSVTLVATMSASITGMIAILASQQNSPREYATALMGYMVIVVLLVTSIVYKFCMEAQTRKTLYYNMWKIGYTKQELKIIVKKEVLWFYFLLLMIPMPYVLVISGIFIYHGEMSVIFSIVIILMYMIPMIASAFITYRAYKKAVLEPIQGGYENGE